MKVNYEYVVIVYCCPFPGCEKSYNSKFNLKRHVETAHLKKKQHQCGMCSKWFTSRQNLNEHYNTHSGAKPFQCKECGLRFRHTSQLSFHKRQHRFQSAEENYPRTFIKNEYYLTGNSEYLL